jgi:hypothetical protein
MKPHNYYHSSASFRVPIALTLEGLSRAMAAFANGPDNAT